jgi:hypothetical protein
MNAPILRKQDMEVILARKLAIGECLRGMMAVLPRIQRKNLHDCNETVVICRLAS